MFVDFVKFSRSFPVIRFNFRIRGVSKLIESIMLSFQSNQLLFQVVRLLWPLTFPCGFLTLLFPFLGHLFIPSDWQKRRVRLINEELLEVRLCLTFQHIKFHFFKKLELVMIRAILHWESQSFGNNSIYPRISQTVRIHGLNLSLVKLGSVEINSQLRSGKSTKKNSIKNSTHSNTTI